MKPPGVMRACALSLLILALLACSREQSSGTALPNGQVAPAPASTTIVVDLADVVEATPNYVIGISYPKSAVKYPQLAAELKRYAESARADLLQAAQSRDASDKTGLYDLSLSFTEVLESPDLVAYAADGSSFTGGAHGAPLLARFVWMPQQGKRLTSADLVPTERGWQAIASYVREELHTALSQRVDADELPPGDRAEVVKSAGRMIDEGTGSDPDNFAQFEPVVNASGKVTALRFVFAPYQVGPYSDGTQTVEVPASVLLPHIAPEYRNLFVRG